MRSRFDAAQTLTDLVGFTQKHLIVKFGQCRIFQVTVIDPDGTGRVSFLFEDKAGHTITSDTVKPLLDEIEAFW